MAKAWNNATARTIRLLAAGVAATATLSWLRLVRRATRPRSLVVSKAVTVNRPIGDVYAFWRDLENLPRFMEHLESVRVQDGLSHWCARAPGGRSVEWDATIVDDRPNELLAWRALPGSDVPNAGAVRFSAAPGGRGTEVHVDLQYEVSGGRTAAAFAKLFGEEPSQQIGVDLRRFKQVLETGEVLR